MDNSTNINEARILIVGLGRLGSRAAALLCDAGVKRLTLCDYDIVLDENLAQQPLYTKEDIGKPKVDAAARRLAAQHPDASIIRIAAMFSPEALSDDIALIIDGTDNLETRLTLNDAARAKGVPLVIATATAGRGMVFPVLPQRDAPCWQCITKGKVAGDDCASGIEPAVADAVAKAQAALALRILHSEHVAPQLLLIDAQRTAAVTVRTNPACSACKGHFEHLGAPFSIQYCASRERVLARPNAPRVLDLDGIRSSEEVVRDYGAAVLVRAGEGTALVHRHGLIEFSDVPHEEAHAFTRRILQG